MQDKGNNIMDVTKYKCMKCEKEFYVESNTKTFPFCPFCRKKKDITYMQRTVSTQLLGLKTYEDKDGKMRGKSERLNIIVIPDYTNTDLATNEEYCKERGEKFFNWFITNVPHGICRWFFKKYVEYQKMIK